jgi:Mg-chelatase subunit ChlD
MGRHSTRPRPRRFFLPVIALGVVLLLGAGAWTLVTVFRARSACADPTRVVVAASPDIAPAVSLVVGGIAKDCVRIEVQARDSAQVAESLAISDGSARPQVWIPDSTLALRRARQLGATDVPVSGPSVASSPVVLAVDQEIADALGWPAKTLTWADVLSASDGGVVAGLPDPARDPVGVAALFGLKDATKTAADPAAAYASLLRRFSPNTESVDTDLFARLPGSSSPASPVTVFPTSENSLLRHNVDQTANGLVAVYSAAAPSLDYPFAVLGSATPPQVAEIEPLLDALVGEPGADAVAQAGLRAAGGQALRNRSDDTHITDEGLKSATMPSGGDVDKILNQWAGINLSSRVQTLIDVSGSMNEEVTGTGKTRMALTLEAAEKGMYLFKPTTRNRTWEFSTKLDGDKDYREVLPMKSVAEHLAGTGLAQLRAIQVKPGGATGLYDSLLAIYKISRTEWEPGRLNVIVIMTDGKNDDAGGISRDDLLAELAGLQDPKRPIPVVGIGIGPDVDDGELRSITQPTGGQAFIAADPGKIADVFYGALSKLSGGR